MTAAIKYDHGQKNIWAWSQNMAAIKKKKNDFRKKDDRGHKGMAEFTKSYRGRKNDCGH